MEMKETSLVCEWRVPSAAIPHTLRENITRSRRYYTTTAVQHGHYP